ncbi:helix-turn-helix transcriptional regulator [Vibrio parahaemolyticus]|uniref:helix-turn-helix domain-containing protein n=1 Tax=Vibrio parahaemolyticus TaxID=670 RepID=UPI00081370F3|nr:helix-turn-helix transcriptional regulator [Vibrio parahaemolyticus]EIZ1364044.1 helix-turn-helix transcriptional regulator [Vibrio vulnificus]EJF9959436.1 helix-turn-helix transcriptional regulator [Vibrio parahaemolyticus]EJF9968670.1 helix-turn-helix transcriptional regulator [Vibrio parahaemolyticus]EJG0147776.1 helix-turn-helix transcriptional regulator [Vibrio parahaemolyticus]EJG0283736.1 helix-turn-helix transcriptional regulator [Vibrio parahaemolyticus]
MDDSKITSFTTITLLILRETRLERGVHQAQVAEKCDKTPSAWAKIETGKTTFTMEMFYRVCAALSTQPSVVMAAAERYATLLSQKGWVVLTKQLESEDQLLNEAHEYYASAGFKARVPLSGWGHHVTALNSPINNWDGTINIVDVFRFALDKDFKEQQLNYKPVEWF